MKEIDGMDASEIRDWQIWLSMEPRGEMRQDIHAGQITQAIYTIQQSFGGDKNSKPVELKDCVIKFESPFTPKPPVDPLKSLKDLIRNKTTGLVLFGRGGDCEKLKKEIRILKRELEEEEAKIEEKQKKVDSDVNNERCKKR